jgi:hypothetical protein
MRRQDIYGWVSSTQALRSVRQVHRDSSSLILGVVLLRLSFASFSAGIIPFCRSRTSFCCVAMLRRSDLSFRHSVASFCRVVLWRRSPSK